LDEASLKAGADEVKLKSTLSRLAVVFLIVAVGICGGCGTCSLSEAETSNVA
jgi:hypothetical protein